MKIKMQTSSGSTMFTVVAFVLTLNVIIGGYATEYLVEFWGTIIKGIVVDVPFWPCAIAGLVLGHHRRYKNILLGSYE